MRPDQTSGTKYLRAVFALLVALGIASVLCYVSVSVGWLMPEYATLRMRFGGDPCEAARLLASVRSPRAFSYLWDAVIEMLRRERLRLVVRPGADGTDFQGLEVVPADGEARKLSQDDWDALEKRAFCMVDLLSSNGRFGGDSRARRIAAGLGSSDPNESCLAAEVFLSSGGSFDLELIAEGAEAAAGSADPFVRMVGSAVLEAAANARRAAPGRKATVRVRAEAVRPLLAPLEE